MTKNLTNTMICWTPGGAVGMVPWPDNAGLSDKYQSTGGAAYPAVQNASFEKRKTIAFIEALHLIVGDRCDPHEVHKAFLELEEYRDGLAPDMPGMNGNPLGPRR